MPKRLHRIHTSSPPCGNVRRGQRDGRQPSKHDNIRERIGGRDTKQDSANRSCERDAERKPDDEAGQCQDCSLRKNSAQHLVGLSTECDADAELARSPPCVEDGERILPKRRDQQRRGGKPGQQDREDARHVREGFRAAPSSFACRRSGVAGPRRASRPARPS